MVIMDGWEYSYYGDVAWWASSGFIETGATVVVVPSGLLCLHDCQWNQRRLVNLYYCLCRSCCSIPEVMPSSCTKMQYCEPADKDLKLLGITVMNCGHHTSGSFPFKYFVEFVLMLD
jgi:hypothetical protein